MQRPAPFTHVAPARTIHISPIKHTQPPNHSKYLAPLRAPGPTCLLSTWPVSDNFVHAGGLNQDNKGSLRMHASLPPHKKYLGFESNNSICWSQSNVAHSDYFSERLCDWAGNRFSTTSQSSPLRHHKRKPEVSTPGPRQKKDELF